MRRSLLPMTLLLPLSIGHAPAQTPSFQQTRIAVGCNPTKVVSGDFNGDRVPDLAFTCRPGSPAPFTVLLGKGDGTFQNPISGSSPALGTVTGNRLVAADFNRDGKTDLAYIAANGDLVILLSAGDGTFKSLVTTPANPKLAMAAAADMNADGIPDLVLFSGLNDSFALIANGKGDGSFSSPTGIPLGTAVTPLSSWAAIGLALGDVNGDGKLDLFINGTPVYAALNTFPVVATFLVLSQRDGSYAPPYLLEYENAPIILGDFNGDGKADLCGTSDSVTCSFG